MRLYRALRALYVGFRFHLLHIVIVSFIDILVLRYDNDIIVIVIDVFCFDIQHQYVPTTTINK